MTSKCPRFCATADRILHGSRSRKRSGEASGAFSRLRAAIVCSAFTLSCVASVRSAGTAVTFPVQLIENLVYTYGRVNGSRELDVVLDTGSSITTISPQAARETGLRLSGSGRAFGTGPAPATQLRSASGVTLDVGLPGHWTRIEDQRIASLPIDFAAQEIGHSTDAFFGSNVFSNACVTVDYSASSVTLLRGACPTAPPGQPIPILLLGGAPFASASIQDASGTWIRGLFLLDSGATAPIVMSERFMRGHPGLALGGRTIELPPTRDVSGLVALRAMRVKAMRLGPFVFDGPIAAIPHASAGLLATGQIAGFIGAPVLSRFRVTWDYPDQRAYMLANSRFTDPFVADESGIRLQASPPNYTAIHIGAIAHASPAEDARLRAGDEIVALNGTSGLPLWGIADRLRVPGDVRMTVRRGRKTLTVTLELRSRI